MVLLERERCLLDLAEWLDAAVEHGGLVELVEGEAGIGKTALLREFSAQQRRVGRVLWGACDALFTPRLSCSGASDYIVAIYLIIIGLLGLFGSGSFHLS